MRKGCWTHEVFAHRKLLETSTGRVLEHVPLPRYAGHPVRDDSDGLYPEAQNEDAYMTEYKIGPLSGCRG